MLDRIDKGIIGLLLKYKGRFLTTNQIATKVKIAPLTAKRHLDKLEKEGYVDVKQSGKTREYDKNGKHKDKSTS